MKRILFILFFVGLTNAVSAQSEVKARIEFEEAEKAFSENNYTASLQRLNEAEKLLGTPSSKILYLKILCQNQIIKPDPFNDFEILLNIRKNCDVYLKLIEKKTDMYERYKEIYKVKQELEVYPKSLSDFNVKKEENSNAKKAENEKKKEAEREKQAFMKDLFERVKFTFEPDKPLEYYTSKYPEFDKFIKKAKKKEDGNETNYFPKTGFGAVFGNLFKVQLDYVVTKNNKVTLVFYTLLAGKNKDKDNFWSEYQKLIQQAKNSYGDKAIKTTTDNSSVTSILNTKELDFNCQIEYYNILSEYRVTVRFNTK